MRVRRWLLARRYLSRRFPDLADAPVVETRVCQYETTPDSHFVIDRHPDLDRRGPEPVVDRRGTGEITARVALELHRAQAELGLGAVIELKPAPGAEAATGRAVAGADGPAEVDAALDEAKIRELNARAAKLETEAQAAAGGGQPGEDVQGALMQVRQQANDEIDRMTEALRKAQADLANQTIRMNKEADTKLEVARIDADTRLRVAEIQATSDKKIQALQDRLDTVMRSIEARNELNQAGKTNAGTNT